VKARLGPPPTKNWQTKWVVKNNLFRSQWNSLNFRFSNLSVKQISTSRSRKARMKVRSHRASIICN
jgi:hypothetical protein